MHGVEPYRTVTSELGEPSLNSAYAGRPSSATRVTVVVEQYPCCSRRMARDKTTVAGFPVFFMSKESRQTGQKIVRF